MNSNLPFEAKNQESNEWKLKYLEELETKSHLSLSDKSINFNENEYNLEKENLGRIIKDQANKIFNLQADNDQIVKDNTELSQKNNLLENRLLNLNKLQGDY